MNVYTDKHLEARALKRGAPEGPRILPRVTCDEEGHYTVYTGKLCRVCDCQLTSRNRQGRSLLCIEHGKEEERARIRRPGGAARAQAKRTGQETAAWVDPCPHRKAVHRALSGFLFHPFDECAYRHTIDVMHEYELRARLLNVLPSPDASDTAVSLTTLTSDAGNSCRTVAPIETIETIES